MGFWELVLVVTVMLLVLSPKQLPVVARSVGRIVAQWRRLWHKLQHDIEQAK